MKIVSMVSRTSWLVWVFLVQAMVLGAGKAEAGEIISHKSKDTPESPREPPLGHAHTNGPALAPKATPSLDDLRLLLHLYSRLGKPKMVEVVAGKIFSRNPGDKETLRLLTSFYLERKDAPRALKHARALVKFHPDDPQAHFQLAMAYKLDRQYRLAEEVLAAVKSEKFQNRVFPYEAELASAAWLSGDWPQAVRSYQEVLEHSTLQPEERIEVRNQLEQLYRTHLPQLFVKEAYSQLESGLILRSALEWSQSLAAHHRLRLELERDDLKLNGTDLLRAQWVNRYDVLAGIESDYLRWRTRVFGGFGDEAAIYGADLTRVLGPDEYLTLAVHLNQRATDSLLLETLRGREDELFLFRKTRFYPDIQANLKLAGRRVLVDGETLGYGCSVELNLERILWKDVPELRLEYRGLITGYSQSSDNIQLVAGVAAPGDSAADRRLLLNELVGPINLHGLYLSWQQTINHEWNWHALVGSDYSFTRSSFGQTVEAGLSYFPSRRTEFVFSAGYSTSASTSDQDPNRVELSLAFRTRF